MLTRLVEKYTSAKLSMLYAKALYLLALSLAQTQHLDESLASTPELLMRHQADVK
jgi:hypothetical protein